MLTNSSICLSEIPSKNRAHVIGFSGGREAQARLLDMGLIPGQDIQVIQNNKRGPVIIGISDYKLALGRGLAHKVIVKRESITP